LKRIALWLFFVTGIFAEDAVASFDVVPESSSAGFKPTSLLGPLPEPSFQDPPTYVADLEYQDFVPVEPAQAYPRRNADDFNSNVSRESEKRGGRFSGWQLGVGVPLVMPMTGYNAWVGYMNKKSEWWLGRRFGARLDFLIPSSMVANGVLRDNGNGYDVDLSARLMGFKWRQNSAFDIDPIIFKNNGVDQHLFLNGAEARVALDNRFVGGLVDFYPFGDTWFLGGWRMSGGYYHGYMKLKMLATVPDQMLGGGYIYEISNNHFITSDIPSGKGRISAQMNWRYSGPYAGLGFDLGVFRGFKFFMDAGVVFARPPRIRQSDIVLPEMAACYTIGTSAKCDWVRFSVNGPNAPDASALMTDVLASLIRQNVQNNNLPQDVIDEIKAEYGANGQINYNQVAGGILGFINNPSSGSPGWMNHPDLVGTEVEDVINNLEFYWAGHGNLISNLQDDIDNMWADYHKGLDDINKSLKDMRLMPVVKLGVMFRF